MICPLFALLAGAAQAWTPIQVFDPPNSQLTIRNIAVVVDGSQDPDEEFFLSDGWSDQTDQAALLYKWHGSSYSTRYTLISDFPTTDDSFYLPSMTTEDGDDYLYVSARYLNTTPAPDQYNLRELVVDRYAPLTAPSPEEHFAIADDDDTKDVKHSVLLLDGDEDTLQSCFTRKITTANEDSLGNHRDLTGIDTGWQATEDTIATATDAGESHCDVATLDSGGRAIVYEWVNEAGDVEIKVRFEATAGTEDYTVTIASEANHTYRWPTIVSRDVTGNRVHVAWTNTTDDTIEYRRCKPGTAAKCDEDTDWTAAIDVHHGTPGIPEYVHLAVDANDVVYAVWANIIAGVNNDRIRVSHLCPNMGASPAFAATDGGLVDGSKQDEHFAQNGGVAGGDGRAYRTITINDQSEKVRVVYMRDDDMDVTDVDWEGMTSATDIVDFATACPVP